MGVTGKISKPTVKFSFDKKREVKMKVKSLPLLPKEMITDLENRLKEGEVFKKVQAEENLFIM